MHYNIAEQLRSALIRMGYPADKCQFDAHSTIEIELENIPALYVSVIKERIWLWTPLLWMNKVIQDTWGGEILEELQQALNWVVTGQPVLGVGENVYELKALVDEECFDADGGFEELLETFYLLCFRLKERFSRI